MNDRNTAALPESCPASTIMPSSGTLPLNDLADLFKLFGDPTRIRLLWALNGHEQCVCDLSASLEMTQSAVSHQLRLLRQSKLVNTKKQGKHVFYSLADDHVQKILEIGLEHILE